MTEVQTVNGTGGGGPSVNHPFIYHFTLTIVILAELKQEATQTDGMKTRNAKAKTSLEHNDN
jgi:hypothetical protein